MAALKRLKVLARSRSPSFTRGYFAQDRESREAKDELGTVTWWSGDQKPVHYRKGTSDVGLVYDILFKPGSKGEYWLPGGLEPKIVLDIGANIGITARYLAHRFPGAAIHAFEPMLENQRLAGRNLAGIGARFHPYGLGSETGTVEFAQPGGARSNRGSFSRFAESDSHSPKIRAELRAAPEVLAALELEHVNLIKLDVEGAERDILCALPDALLARADWVYGELHTEAVDPRLAFGALERLAPWFDIELHKPLRKRNWFFDACNRRISGRFRGFRRDH